MLEVNKQTILVSEGQREAFIQLRKNNQLRGFSGCNQITGSYTVNTSQQILTFNQIHITEKSCPASMKQQNNIVSMLLKVNTYKISGDNLFLYHKDNDVIAKLAAIYF